MYGDITYMKIDDYANGLIFTGAEEYPRQAPPMAVTRDGSVYETTAYDGTKGVFDAGADTFECEDSDRYTMAIRNIPVVRKHLPGRCAAIATLI